MYVCMVVLMYVCMCCQINVDSNDVYVVLIFLMLFSTMLFSNVDVCMDFVVKCMSFLYLGRDGRSK